MQKPKTFRPWVLGQTSLLPASPSDWLSADHQVYFLLDLVDELDLSARCQLRRRVASIT